MNSKINLPKSSISYLFDELIKVQNSWRQFLILFKILFIIFDDTVSIFHNLFVKKFLLTNIQNFLFFVDWTSSRSICRCIGRIDSFWFILSLLLIAWVGIWWLLITFDQNLYHSVSELFLVTSTSFLFLLKNQLVLDVEIFDIGIYLQVDSSIVDLLIWSRIFVCILSLLGVYWKMIDSILSALRGNLCRNLSW